MPTNASKAATSGIVAGTVDAVVGWGARRCERQQCDSTSLMRSILKALDVDREVQCQVLS
jgi:hypothetical protein